MNRYTAKSYVCLQDKQAYVRMYQKDEEMRMLSLCSKTIRILCILFNWRLGF